MITGLDHFVLICPDITVGADAYKRLLGQPPVWRSLPQDGAATALFQMGNTALELLAPDGKGAVGDRLREMLAETGPRLTSLAFQSDALGDDHRLFARRGLGVSDVTGGASTDADTGRMRQWQRFRCADDACAGIKTFVLAHETEPLTAPEAAPGAIHALDHIVISTPNPDRAAALYGARLGLHLALDRTAEEWNTRFLFFRTGGLTFEVIHRLGEVQDTTGPDTIWGLTWAVQDLEAAHSRLLADGLNVSDVRKGRKPGSRVFTVREGTLGVPTLFIAHAAR